MPRKNNRQTSIEKTNVSYIKNFQCIELTDHVLQRARLRRSDLKGVSIKKIKLRMIHEIKCSKIIRINGIEEHRIFNGHIYVVKRIDGKVVAITYLLSKKKHEERKLNNRCIA